MKRMKLLSVDRIKKSFGHVEALRDVSMDAYAGEVLAIVGDNGAGKSTLIKIISGVLTPDEGTITIDGKSCHGFTAREAIRAGVSTVYQDLALGNTMDVASNIFLGTELTRAGFLDKKAMRRSAEELLRDLNIQIPDVKAAVGDLSGGQRQGVAVARLVHNGGRIMIFDEPTAAMGLNESNAVLRLIRKLADDGYAVIMISHNMPHVFEISDRICVMRQGRIVKCLHTPETDMEQVVSLITGSITAEKVRDAS